MFVRAWIENKRMKQCYTQVLSTDSVGIQTVLCTQTSIQLLAIVLSIYTMKPPIMDPPTRGQPLIRDALHGTICILLVLFSHQRTL